MSDELPRGWTSTRLAELVAFNPKHPATIPDATPVTFVPMAAVSESSPTLDTSVTRPLSEVRKGYTHFANNDVLFAKITPCMENGKGAVASELVNGLGCGTTELVVMRSLGAIEPHVLYRFLAQPSVRRAAKENFTGTAGQARVPLSFLEELELPLPPLAEQRRIVAKLAEVLGKVDASRARLAKIPALLKRFRQSVLAAACSGRLTTDWREKNLDASAASYIEELRSKRPAKFQDASVRADLDLPEIPESWTWTNLRFLLSPMEAFCYGVVQPGANDPMGALLVRAGDLKNGWVDTQALRRIPKNIHEAYRRSQLSGGEILVTVVGAGIGETALVQPECAGFNIARAVAKLPVREFNARYVRHWLTTNRAVTWMKGDSREVARPTLNIEQLQTLPVPIPPLPEQQEIVRRVEALFALADKIEARFRQAQARVEQLTPALLAQAFRGELVPQDPADEPAYVLLERIRQGRGGISDPALQRITYPEPAPRELKVAEPRSKPAKRRRS